MVSHARLAGGLDAKGIEIRRLSRPEHGIGNHNRCGRDILHRDGVEDNILSPRGGNRETDLFHAGRHESRDLEAAGRGGPDIEVLDADLGTGEYIGVPGQARQAPEVLVLQIGAVAPAEDLQRDEVLPGRHIFRDVEAGLQLAVLTVAHFLAVHPDAHVGGGGSDAEEDVLAQPGRIDEEGPAILSGIVVLERRDGRIVPVMTLPGIADVDIERIPVAVELPESGDRHVVPGRIIHTRLVEVAGTGVDRLVPLEFPQSVEGQLVSVRLETGCHFDAVASVYGGVDPILDGRFPGGKKREGGQQSGRDHQSFAHRASSPRQRCRPDLR